MLTRTSPSRTILGLNFVRAVWQGGTDLTLSPLFIIMSESHSLAALQNRLLSGCAIVIMRLFVLNLLQSNAGTACTVCV